MLATNHCPTETAQLEHLVALPPRAAPPCADDLTRSLPEGKVRVVSAKEHVYREGDPATHVYRVEAGYVCIYRGLPDGRRQIVNFAYPGDFIGLGAFRDHSASALAGTKTRLKSFPVAGLRDSARRDTNLGLRLYEAVSEELAAAHDLLMTVSHRSAGERLAAFLLALSRRNGRRGENEREIVLPMTRTDIADFLGLTIETVSRTFTKFRIEGLIDLEQCILVTICDLAALEMAAGNGASSEQHLKLAS
jgi:CRP-like cAMP-binding protein